MGHLDLLEYSIRGLGGRQLRSYLTILGVIIGIAAIVSIVSIGQGLNEYIQEQLMVFGTDYIAVNPGTMEDYMSGGMATIAKSTLTENDRKAIEGIGGVKDVYGTITMPTTIEYKGQVGSTLVIGGDEGIWEAFPAYKVREGRLYRANSGEVVLGAGLADNTFDRKIRVGDALRIGNASFRVVGIMEEAGGMYAMVNSVALVDVHDLVRATGMSMMGISYDEIDVKLEPGADADEVGRQIEEKLRNLHKVTEENQDFMVWTPSGINEMIGGIMNTLNLFLAGLASIALVVGGVGIANTMFMAVGERTREIGVMKAVGATDRDIMEIFIFESGMIGLAGGIIGCAIGLAVSYGMNYFGVPSKVDISLVGWALGFSFAVGAISGYFPARRAAKLEPVEALRYE